ncbi:MAG TPA: response regulator transcription factor [Vicinamibacterales bacterium]|nr:response regulator transcription factor [Vicinamibacterales bacterium]
MSNGSLPGKAQTAPPIRVTLADDHPLVLNGLYHLLHEYPEFQVLDRCTSGSGVLAAVRRQRPDVLVLDLLMPDIDGLTVARTLHTTGELPRTVLLTAQLHEDQLIEALHLGIRGFVLKEMAPTLLVECLRRVHAGGQWLEKDSANRAMAKLVRREAKGTEIAKLLTPREIDVVKMVAKGLTNKEIGDRLCIADATVKIHLHNIYEKAKINRRAQLVRFAEDYGLT